MKTHFLMQNDIKQQLVDILGIQEIQVDIVKQYMIDYIKNNKDTLNSQYLLNIIKNDFSEYADIFFYVIQLLAWILYQYDELIIDSQQAQKIILNISQIYNKLKKQKQKYQEVIINFLNNLLIKTKKFICLNTEDAVIPEDNFYTDIIQTLIEDQQLLLILIQINIKYDKFEDLVEALTYIDDKVEIKLCDSMIEQLSDYLSQNLMMLFLKKDKQQLDYLHKYIEIDIPFVNKNISNKISMQVQNFATDIEDMNQNLQSDEQEVDTLQQHFQQCQFLTEKCIKFFYDQAQNVFKTIQFKIEVNQEIEQYIYQITYVLQILEQYLSVNTSSWKSKIICQYFYTQIALILHYNFHNQDKKKPGRFDYFFGLEVEKLRCTIIFILANMTLNCPCSWDMIRIFKLLELLCVGMLGDGKMAGVKEVSQMVLTYACDYCQANIDYLEDLRDKTAGRAIVM